MIDVFTRRGVCANCEQPIHSVGRSAIHTDSDMFTCEGGHAEFLSTDMTEGAREAIFNEGYDEGYNEAERELDGAADLAHEKGRRELAKELCEWISIHKIEAAIIDLLLDRLADE